jgi:hypothetical protein
MPGPQPLPLPLIVSLFNMPNISGPNISTPNIQAPTMPSVNAPNVYGPTFDGPTISSSGIQGPQFQGPQFQGPSYNGPQMPGQGYSSAGAPAAERTGGSEGKYAGFWLGVLIFVWVLAIASLIVLGLFLAGFNVNPFNYQRYKAQDVMTAFTAAGLEIGRPTSYGSSGGFGAQQPPFNYVDGFNFTVPSSGPTGAGGITSFSSGSELDKAKSYLSDQTKTGAIPYRIYTKDNILIYLNVSSEAKAKQYEAALDNMK